MPYEGVNEQGLFVGIAALPDTDTPYGKSVAPLPLCFLSPVICGFGHQHIIKRVIIKNVEFIVYV